MEVLRQIKSDVRTRFIPVIVLTSPHLEKEVSESYQLGANSFFVKGVVPEKVRESIRQLAIYWLGYNKFQCETI